MSTIAARLDSYIQLTRLNKPIGIYLLLWPTLSALWLAGNGQPGWKNVVIFILGVVIMRSAGCVINDYVDRKIDAAVKRTAERPLVSGQITPRQALLLFLGLLVTALLLALQLPPLALKLSIIGAALATFYPFTKRYTHWPQAFLGAAFAWAIPMAFAAETGSLDPRMWLLFSATLLWALIYDTMYAMVDRDDDLDIGVKSTAILFGNDDRLVIGILQIIMFSLLITVGIVFSLHQYYYFAIFIAIMLAIYHQWLIRARDRDACFRAFLHNHWIGLTLFIGIVIDYLL